MIAAEREYLGYALPFPASIQGYHLAELGPAGGQWQVALAGAGGPREAVYNSDGQYRSVTMDVFSLRQFPEMALGGPMVSAGGSGYVVNATLVSSLIYWDYYNQASQGLIQTRSGTDIAGDYATRVAPSKLDSDHSAAGALVWGKSPDKKLDILVAISARDVTMDEIVRLVKSLKIA